MSAFVVNEEHVKQLTLVAARWEAHTRRTAEEATDIAQELMRENIRSVMRRYPDCTVRDLPGPIPTPEADLIEISEMELARGVDPYLTPVDILSMCDCLEYQSCETGDEYWSTDGFHWLQRIRKTAYRRLHGYDEAPWEYRPEDIRKRDQDKRDAASERLGL